MDINTPLSVKLTSRGQLTGGLGWVLAFRVEKARLIDRHQNGCGGKLSWLANESSWSTSSRKGVSLSFPEGSKLDLIILEAREQLRFPLSGMILEAKYFLKIKFFPPQGGVGPTGTSSCRDRVLSGPVLYRESQLP